MSTIESLQEEIKKINQRLSSLEQAFASKDKSKTKTLDAIQIPDRVTIPDRVSEFKAPVQESKVSSGSLAAVQGTSQALAIVAVLCFILAGGFIVKLAIDSGWLTAFRQWSLFTLLGFGLISVGRFAKTLDQGYRGYLSAAGSILLYASAYTSSAYFHLVTPLASVFLGLAATGICLHLFSYHKTQFFAVIAIVGTYLSPFLLGVSERGWDISAGFFILWAILFSWFAIHYKERVVTLLASYFSFAVYAFLNLSLSEPSEISFVLLVLLIQFLIFAFGVFRHSQIHQVQLTSFESWSYFPILCFYYGISYYFLNKILGEWTPWMALGFGTAVLILYQSTAKKLEIKNKLNSNEMIYAFFSLVVIQTGYLQLLPESGKPWLLAILILISYLGQQKQSLPQVARVFKFFGFLIAGIEYLRLSWSLLESFSLNNLIASLATLAVGFLYYLNHFKKIKDYNYIFLCLVHVLAVVTLYRLAFDFGSLAVSAAWGLYAGIILGFGFKQMDIYLAKSSLLVLILSALKALIYDASAAPTGLRIVCLLLTGALLYVAGYTFKKISDWKV
jgi:hypothetical protein